MALRSILLVEDNENDELLTLRALKQHRVINPVTVARDGGEALEYLFGTGSDEGREVIKLPALVLLDLKLPKVSGLQVLSKVRSHEPTSRVPVVILTSSDEEKDICESYRLGANSYVRKPVEFDEFVDAVGALGIYWTMVNESPPR